MPKAGFVYVLVMMEGHGCQVRTLQCKNSNALAQGRAGARRIYTAWNRP